MLDILIRNGRIVDGSGSPWFRGEIGIRGERVVSVRHRVHEEAARTIDAAGLVISRRRTPSCSRASPLP
jgi:N-acyl-D-amino-acid deacylase